MWTAWRIRRARRGSTIALVFVLAIGVGLTVAMFALSRPFVFRVLPYKNVSRLVVIRLSLTNLGTAVNFDRVPTLSDWRNNTDLFDGIAAFEDGQRLVRVATENGVAILRTRAVSPDFPEVLGFPASQWPYWQVSKANPTRSRALLLLPERTASVGERIGSSVFLDNSSHESFQVAGSLPQGFVFPEVQVNRRPDALTTADFGRLVEQEGGYTRFLQVIARLRHGVSRESVRARFSGQLRDSGFGLQVESLGDYMTRMSRPLAFAALIAGILVISASVANAANLIAIDTAYRAQEFATRRALGAMPADIVRLLASEMAMVAVMISAVSVVIAMCMLAALSRAIPFQYVSLGRPRVDSWSICACLLLSGAVSIAAAFPAWLGLRSSARRTEQRLNTRRLPLRWLRMLSMFGQVAVTMVLLIAASLIIRSTLRLLLQDSGFSGDVAVAAVSYPPGTAPDRLQQDLQLTVAALTSRMPTKAAAAIVGPFIDETGLVGGYGIDVGGRAIGIMPKEVTSHYFEVVGATVIAGRGFVDADEGWNAVVVDQTLAFRLWPGRQYSDLIGQPLKIVTDNATGHIVGVVKDMYDRALDRQPTGTMFRPLSRPLGGLSVNVMVRLDDTTIDYRSTVRRTVVEINPQAVVVGVDLLRRRLGGTIRAKEFTTMIIACFAVAAVGVTISGVLGVIDFIVLRRTKEIAIRRAIGALPGHVLWIVSSETVGVAGAGAATGWLLGYSAARVLENQLYGIRPHDGMSLLAAAGMIVVVIAGASYLSARRALRIEPNVALRAD